MNLVDTGKRILIGAGAQAVLVLLVALSIWSLGVMIERGWAFFVRRGDFTALRADLLSTLRTGGFAEAANAMRGSRHPAAAVALRALTLSRGPKLPPARAAEEAMNAEILVQKGGLDARLGVLATLGANAPFVGLFGTVVGIVGAFDALGHANGALGGASAQGSLAVMSAIGESLVATAVGIGVAIPAVAAFNYFTRLSRNLLTGAEILQRELLAYIEEHALTAEPVEESGPRPSLNGEGSSIPQADGI